MTNACALLPRAHEDPHAAPHHCQPQARPQRHNATTAPSARSSNVGTRSLISDLKLVPLPTRRLGGCWVTRLRCNISWPSALLRSFPLLPGDQAERSRRPSGDPPRARQRAGPETIMLEAPVDLRSSITHGRWADEEIYFDHAWKSSVRSQLRAPKYPRKSRMCSETAGPYCILVAAQDRTATGEGS